MEVALSVIDVGILAIVPEGAPNQTTGLYRLESAATFLTWQVSKVLAYRIIVSALIIGLSDTSQLRLILNC